MTEMINKINWPLCIGILAGLLAIFGSISQWKEKKDEASNALAAQTQLKKLQTETLNNTKSLADSYKENARLQSLLNFKSDSILNSTLLLAEMYKENAKLQEELKNQVTGGDNKPTLILTTSTLSSENSEVFYVTRFSIANLGKYPLNSVRVSITDFFGSIYENKIKIKPQGRGESVSSISDKTFVMNDMAKNFHFGTLNKTQEEYFYASAYQIEQNQHRPYFNISISWNNGILNFNVTTELSDKKLVIKEVKGTFNGEPIIVNQQLLIFDATN